MAKPNLLLVEDDQFLVKAMLMKFDGLFTVKTATTAEEGLEILKKWRPQAIVLDILLPGQDGYSLLRAVKDNPDTKDIPIIISSNLDERIGSDPRADDYIVKSNLDLDELASRIKSHLK